MTKLCKGDWVQLNPDVMGEKELSLQGFRPIDADEWERWKRQHNKKNGAWSIRAGDPQPPLTKRFPLHRGVVYKVVEGSCDMRHPGGTGAMAKKMTSVLDPLTGHTIYVKRTYLMKAPKR